MRSSLNKARSVGDDQRCSVMADGRTSPTGASLEGLFKQSDTQWVRTVPIIATRIPTYTAASTPIILVRPCKCTQVQLLAGRVPDVAVRIPYQPIVNGAWPAV